MNRPLSLAVLALVTGTLTFTGCAAQTSNDPETTPRVIAHVHAIAEDPRGDDLLVATHNGIFTITQEGTVAGPIGGHDFDAMGFTVAGNILYASGHPGSETPSDLGAPNLGLIRSDDFGATWSPVALNGTTDFHVLTAGPDGTLYGAPSSQVDLLISTNEGRDWVTGASVPAADLAATEAGLYAAAEEGLLISTDQGKTFAPVDGAPLLYTLDAAPDGTLVGVGTDGAVWSQAGAGDWERIGSLQGAAQAFSVIGTGRFVVVDDRGVVQITPEGTTVLAAAS